MTRLFYRTEDRIYLDKMAFFEMAEENYPGIDDINEIFGIYSSIGNSNLIEI